MSWRDQAPPVDDGPAYVVLNFGSNEPGRNWPLDNYFDLARRILDTGKRVVFVGCDNEKRVKPLLQRDLAHSGVVDLIGETSLPELMDTLNHAALVVTNETGPGHLALILGTPTVMIYGGGHASSFMPYPDNYRRPGVRFVNHEMPCYHCLWICDKRESEDQAFPCIAAIGVDEVWDEVEMCLTKTKAVEPVEPAVPRGTG
jgi:ADP-heptose:LPS heptosyltransferase